MDDRPPRDTLNGRRGPPQPGGRPLVNSGGRPFRFGHDNATLADDATKFEWIQKDIEIQLSSVLTIAFIGIPVNIVCICVLVKGIRKRPGVFKVFLGFISMATLFLFVLSLIACQFILARILFEYGSAVHTLSMIFRYAQSFLDKSLSALVLLISTNRLLLINWPLVARNYVIVRFPGRAALGIVLVVALVSIPPILEEKRTQAEGDGVADTTIPYYTTIMSVINCILAVSLVGINTVLTIKYAQHVRKRQAILSSATNATTNNKVIYVGATVAMSTIYIINTIPATIVETLKMMNLNRLGEFNQVYAKSQLVGFILNALSAACYGPIFLWTSKENRDELKKRLPCVGRAERRLQAK